MKEHATGPACTAASRENTLPPAVWARWQATLGWWLSHPGMRAWWAAKPVPLARDFEAFGDEMIRHKRFDAAAIERWRGFVAGEGMSSSPAGNPVSSVW